MNPQHARLREEHRRLQALAQAHPDAITIVKVDDDPPVRYLLDLHCTGAASLNEVSDEVVLKKTFRVQIDMGSKYPVQRPAVHVGSPFFNPHIFSSGAVCLGMPWTPTQSLDVFVRRLWGLLVWDPEVLDEMSPADSDAIAWFKRHKDRVPFDRVDPTLPPKAPPEPPPPPKPRITWRG